MPVIDRRAAGTQVLDDGFANTGRQWVNGRVPALACRHLQLRVRPVQVVQLQSCDLACAQAVAGQQQHDSVVTLAHGGAAVDAIKNLLNISPWEATRQR